MTDQLKSSAPIEGSELQRFLDGMVGLVKSGVDVRFIASPTCGAVLRFEYHTNLDLFVVPKLDSGVAVVDLVKQHFDLEETWND